jgi:hypothetical protein
MTDERPASKHRRQGASLDLCPTRSESGSALVIAMLISVILALLGISFLMIAETESKLAQNEKRAAQTLYVAEAGLRTVTRWFDLTDTSIGFPPSAAVDRTLRRVIDESDPYDPADVTPADGVVGSYPYYKQGVDDDGDGVTDLFDPPYRGQLVHELLGTPDGPDMRIDDGDAAGAVFLADLSRDLLADFPGEPGGVTARISRIDIYAPPYSPFGSNWRRYGLASVKVTARVYRDVGGTLEVLGENAVKGVLSETPYRAPHGPVHSCGNTSFVPRDGTDLTVRWGAITSVGDTLLTHFLLPPSFPGVPMSLPRDLPFKAGADQLWPPAATDFDIHALAIDDEWIDDPWFRVVSRGSISGAPSGVSQADPPSLTAQDRSNLIQDQALVVCPQYDYDVWKGIAQSGARDVHYYTWESADQFSENGTVPAESFYDITNGKEGVYFFDTRTHVAPSDTDGDGLFDDNLTPPITLSGNWTFRGFIFLNAISIQANGLAGQPTVVRPPGEPFLDLDLDGAYDAGERYINLEYPTLASEVDGDVFTDTTNGGAVRDARGAPISDVPISFQGIFYNTGYFEATGTGAFYGSVIALLGVTQSPADGSVDTPTIIWDQSIEDDWPPIGWDLPRVVITEWDTDG